MIDDLYSLKILSLAAHMPRTGRLAAPDGSAERVAKLCGSRARVDLKLEGDRVVDFAQEVEACALGRATASIAGGARDRRGGLRDRSRPRSDRASC